MVMDNRQKGWAGEGLAVDYLRENGFRIIAQNWQSRLGEIDIIAEDKETLVFIEVKTRRTASYGLPQEAVTHYKQKQIIKTALGYLKSKRFINRDIRFDVVSILEEKVELIKNAFQSDGRYRY